MGSHRLRGASIDPESPRLASERVLPKFCPHAVRIAGDMIMAAIESEGVRPIEKVMAEPWGEPLV